MAVDEHIISRQIFEIDFPSGAVDEANDLYERVKSVYELSLTKVIEEVFDQCSKKDEVLHMEQLVLDLPPIDLDRLESEFVEAVRTALLKILAPETFQEVNWMEENIAFKANGENRIELIEYFLVHGYLPWWAKVDDDPIQFFKTLINSSSLELASMLRRIGKVPYVIQRIVSVLEIEDLEGLVRILEPAEAELIIDYTRSISAIHRRRRQINVSEKEFDRATWEFVLSYILIERGSVFNTKAFLRSNLKGISSRFNVGYQEVLTHFHSATLDKEVMADYSELGRLINAIYSEDVDEIRSSSDSSATDQMEIKEEWIFLKELIKGRIVARESKRRLEMVLRKILHSDRSGLSKFFLELTRQSHIPDHFIDAIPLENLLEVLKGFPEKVVKKVIEAYDHRGVKLDLIPKFLHLAFFDEAALNFDADKDWILQELMKKDRSWLLDFLKANRSNQDLVERIERQFTPQILNEIVKDIPDWKSISSSEAKPDQEGQNKREAEVLKLFLYFLSNHSIPPDHLIQGKIKFNTTLQKLFASRPLQLKQLIRRLIKKNEDLTVLSLLSPKTLQLLRAALDDNVKSELDKSLERNSGHEILTGPKSESLIVLLEFLEKGTLTESRFLSMEELLVATIESNKDELIQNLRSSHVINTVSDRLVWYFSENILNRFLESLAGSEYSRAKEYIELVVSFLHNIELPNEERWTLRKTAIQWLIQWYLTKSQGQFSPSDFFIYAISQVQVKFSISQPRMAKEIKRLKDKNVLAKTTSNLRLESLLKSLGQKAIEEESIEPKRIKDFLAYLLKYNKVPWWSDTPQEDRWSIAAEYMLTYPGSWRLALRSLDYSTLSKTKLFENLNEEQLLTLTGILESRFFSIPQYVKLFGIVERKLLSFSNPFVTGRNFLWKVLVTNILFEQKGSFSLERLLTSTARHIARTYSLSFEMVIHLLLEAQNELSDSGPVGVALQKIARKHSAKLPEVLRQENIKSRKHTSLPLSIEEVRIFLQTDKFPSWSSLNNDSLFFENLNELIEDFPENMLSLFKELGKSKKARSKLVDFPKNEFDNVVILFFGREVLQFISYESVIWKLWKKKSPGTLNRKEFSQFWKMQFLIFGIKKNTYGNFNPLEFLNFFLLELASISRVSYHDVLDTFRSGLIEMGSESPHRLQVYFTVLGNRVGAIQKSQIPAKNKKEEIEDKMEKDLEKREAIYVNNAGLVLVWSFLPRLFEHLGLVKNSDFVSLEARHRAVYLMQYIATGQEGSPEYHLTLNKLLAGIIDVKPVLTDKSLSDEEKLMVQSLLNSVIQHWEIIKDTSIEGFRGSFLIRNGKLNESEENWELTVESKAYDMLLDQLPWSINVIKLPWMNKTLYVKWR